MKLKFWGTRGSIPTPLPDRMRFGGDTSCVELRTPGGHLVILDAGTGVRRLGKALFADPTFKKRGYILLSHAHWDHIQGIPFFGPAFVNGHEFTFYGMFKLEGTLEDILTGQMEHIYFPVKMVEMGAQFHFVEILEETFPIEDVKVTSRTQYHPQNSIGYRIEGGGWVVTYCTDNEHKPGAVDDRILELARGADILVYDTHFLPEDFEKHVGWGHSTYEEGIKICRLAGVRQLVLFHHNPEYDDDQIDAMWARARAEFPNTIAASRDLTIGLREREGPRAEEPTEPALERQGDLLVVRTGAGSAAFHGEPFLKRVRRELKNEPKAVAIDFDGIEAVDTYLVESVAAIAESARKRKVPCCVAGADAFVRQAFDEVAKLPPSVEVLPTLDEARRKVGASA